MNSTPKEEHLFQFEFAPVENITPWSDSEGGDLSLSLYALTDGHFRILAGKDVLLQYTPEIITRWGLLVEDAEYLVACFARDVLKSVSAVTSPIPAFFENIVRDEALFRQLRKTPAKHSHEKAPSVVINKFLGRNPNNDTELERYDAFRWLGERSIWLNYLNACPDIWFVRVGDEVWIQWDNVDRKFEGIDVWTARRGTYAIPVDAFIAECHSFSERLLSAMESRIESIEKGFVCAQIPLDTVSLRNQLLEFRNEFEKKLLTRRQADIDWEVSEKALRKIALNSGITLPPIDLPIC